MALVAEAVLEHEAAVRPHAPLLAHLALLAGDVGQRPTNTLTGTLLAHLLAALSLQHLQLQRASGALLRNCGRGVTCHSSGRLCALMFC